MNADLRIRSKMYLLYDQSAFLPTTLAFAASHLSLTHVSILINVSERTSAPLVGSPPRQPSLPRPAQSVLVITAQRGSVHRPLAIYISLCSPQATSVHS
jgi:hypothetical protein